MMTLEVVKTPKHDIRFDLPLYTVAEAARALDVPPTTLSTWAFGYVRKPTGRREHRGEPVVTAFPGPQGPRIPFVGLAEGMVLAAFRQSGVSLQRVRPALSVLASDIGIEHALASKRLYTDGAELLFDHAAQLAGDEGDAVRELVVIRSGQRVFSAIIEAYLRRIDYSSDGYARLIRLPAYERAEVVADPDRAFGQPIFARGGARVSDVLDRFWSGDDIQTLSEEFGIPKPEIEDVLRAASRRAA
ncbi:MAG: DUF433 domain-containing protein [Acidimicrobiales bacterium]|jgi:uncharacterized protein (DUF433 family)